MSEFMLHTWGVGTDSDKYFTLTITPEGLTWNSGPLSESYVASVTEEQSFDDFMGEGAPEGKFREHMEKYPGYSKYVTEAIGSLADTGNFELTEPDKSEHIWLKFDELLEKKNELYSPKIPFSHYKWVYEPGSLYPESDGNMRTTGVFFNEMENMELKGYYLGEVFIIKGFMEVD